MTQTNVNTGGATQLTYGVVGTLAGGVNLQAAHTLAIRVRHTSTVTTFDSVCIGMATNGGNQSGSYLGRATGNGSGVIAAYRFNGVASVNNAPIPSGAYGNTTSWLHLAFVYDATNVISFLNGVQQASIASATTFVTSTANVAMGVGGPHPGVFCDGVAFSRALSAAEILDLANIRRPKTGRGDCFGWWPEFADSVTTDYSGFGNNLSIVGSGGTNPAASNENPPTAWSGQATYFFLRQGPAPIDGSGNVRTAGSAAVSSAAALTGSGNSSVSASGTVGQGRAVDGTGASTVSGSGTVSRGMAINGLGACSVSGSATVSVATALQGSGQVSVSGAGSFTSAPGAAAGDDQPTDRRWLGALETRRRVRR